NKLIPDAKKIAKDNIPKNQMACSDPPEQRPSNAISLPLTKPTPNKNPTRKTSQLPVIKLK
ncbi:hypothetical protein ACO1LQ_14015, partial [Staphylococcus aureus]